MYRVAIGWKALRDGVDVNEEGAVAAVAERSDISITAESGDDRRRGRDAGHQDAGDRSRGDLGGPVAASTGSARAARQRAMGEGGGIVMEGRDIGNVVFPHADVKIYLDAHPEERARRRASDPAHSGGPTAVADVATLLTERDQSDRTRAASPLYAAPDAVVIDTTGKMIDEVVAAVMAVIRQRLES